MSATTPDLQQIIIDGIHDKKGCRITVLDLSHIESAPSHKFIICQASNPVQVAAIADSVADSMLEHAGRKPSNTDGYRNREWLILDYGEVMVHIFLPDTRTRYALENLWSDARITDIPDIDCHTIPLSYS